MNKQLIITYFEEFKHWLNGGEVLFFYWEDWYSSTYNPEMVFNHISPDDVKYYVINDEFVEFRKALAEGKVIQYYECVYQDERYANLDKYDWLDWKSATPSSSFTKSLNYRIKPEEPKLQK